MLEDSQRRARGVGADLIVRAPSASVINLSGPALDQRLTGFLETQPHVAMAVGTTMHAVDLPLFITGLDLARFTRMSGGFTYVEGGPFRGADDILVDRSYAAQK